MVKFDLKKYTGLPLFLQNGEIVSKDFSFKKVIKIYPNNLKPQILNKSVNNAGLIYTKYIQLDNKEIFKNKNISINLYLVTPSKIGIEPSKTIATISRDFVRIIDITQGSGIIIMQNYKNDKLLDVVLVRFKNHQKIIVPPGYSYSLINTKKENLIYFEICSSECKTRRVLDQMSGMSYYVINKNNKLEIVGNPQYKDLKKYRKINFEELISTLNLSPITPVVKQVLRKYDKFDWLFKKNSFTF